MARKKQVEMRRKQAIQQAQHGDELANLNQFDNIQVELRQVDRVEEEGVTMMAGCSTQTSLPAALEIALLANAAHFRISATVRQAILGQQFMIRYTSPPNSQTQAAPVNVAGNHQLTNSFDHFIDEEIKFGLKSIPKVISLGLNVILDIIKDTYEQNPKICIRSLESLYNLLQGLKPESLKYEPYYMIEKFFDLISSLISLSYSAIGRKYNPMILFDNYQSKVFELSLLSFITLSIARGDTSKILNCIKILLIECNDSAILLDNYNSHNGHFDIEIPEIMILLQKNVCSFLLGRYNVPEWHQLGFPAKSLCESFGVQYTYHQKNLNKIVFSPRSKAECPTSLTFDGQFLILYRCKRLFLIASGYNNSSLGHEIFSAPVDISNLKERFAIEKHEQCCFGGWVGYINGDLFLQPNLSWCCNQIMHLDARSFKVKSIVPLIADYAEKSPFLNPTLATTDGEFLILITVIQEDFVIIRELKPLKLNLETSQMKEKLSFSLVTEFTVRLSSMYVAFCGSSTTLVLPSVSIASNLAEGIHDPSQIRLIDSTQLFEAKEVISLVTGKDFALMLNEQGKVFYMGNSASLGLRHVQLSDRWLMLTIPKPVKIVQVAVGHEGSHALLLSDDSTVFFVGLAKRGEDGEALLRGCRVSKPCRVKKFAKVDLSHSPLYVACNHATSAIVLKSGDLYLFGKDSQHANSKGKVLLPKDFEVKGVALGKAHMLILSKNGLVATSGFSNKGQCGITQLNSSGQDSPKHASSSHMEASLDSKLHISGHAFNFGKCRRCSVCGKCTEYASKCPMLVLMPKAIDECGCGDGNSGCIYCGVCTVCAQINTICKRDAEALERAALSKSFQNVELRPELCLQRKYSKIILTNLSNEIEIEIDNPSKMTSLPPTVLFFTQENPIAQIAAGLHHSVLLTKKGEVYTFGSNQFGQLGLGDFNNRSSPTRIKIEYTTRGFIEQIAAGSNHTVLLTSIGEVITFGNNQNGQLGRSCYNSCKLDYPWNSFPGKMDNVGPDYGRMASFISATGDFTFVKYYEMLLSPNLLTRAKLMAEKSCLILVPPQVNKRKSFDDLFEEKSCKHYFCRSESSTTAPNNQSMFNNLNSNVLVISRSNGSCSILNPVSALRTLPEKKRFLTETEVKNQIDFESFSSILIDKFYNNFWTYNSMRDEFSRFNLMTLEITNKMLTLTRERPFRDQLPTSLLKLSQINALHHPSMQYMKHVPSAIQPDLAIPISDYCLLKQTPQQMALELFCSLTSLTYSHLLGLSVNDKMEQLNYLARTFLPEEYACVNRFEDYGGGWGYPPNSVEAIRFSVDSEIILGGIGLYGGRGEYSVQIRLFDLGNDADVERDGDLLSETDVIHYECLPRQKYQVFFDDPILIQANRWYAVWASINGPSSDCGSLGQPFVCSADQVMFHFKQSKMANNGTDVNAGQIPVLFYRPVKLNEISLHYNNSTHNLSSLSLDDEGLPFFISKDFVLKINSCCVFSLCDILRNVWQNLRPLLVGPKLIELLSTDDQEKLLDRLNNLISEVKKHVYTACFALELIRAYTQIFLPANEYELGNQDNRKIGNCSHYSQIQKFLNYDYDEYKRIANSLFEVCNLLTAILLDPIELTQVVSEKLGESGHWRSTRHRLRAMLQLSHFFTEECYHTFQACCYAFYPTHALKWSVLCDLLSPVLHLPLQGESCPPMFTNRQLYLLSALIKAFSVPSIRLISFFPLRYGSIYESFEDFTELGDLMNPVLDISDLSCHVITKKLSEFFTYDDLYLSKSYTCQFVYESLLSIIVHPIRYMVEHMENRGTRPETTSRSYENYCQFGTGFSEANTSNVSYSNHGDLSSPSTSSSTTSNTFEEEENEHPSTFNHWPSLPVPKDSSPDSSFKELVDTPFASRQIYTKRLVTGASNILLKFISEYSASALGLISNSSHPDSSTMFLLNSEYATPSRFCRRSSSKSWEAGSGLPEAICFSVNKPGIHISGVRVYSSTIGQFKYQLQLLDQAFDDNKTEKNNFMWKTLASVSGVYSYEETPSCRLNDFCELRFERPIVIQPNIKYAVVFKNYSTYSFSGDMGMPQVRGDDDTIFTFMDCSLSKNGTNLNRGQIPQILYYNLPGGLKPSQLGEEEPYHQHRNFNSSVAHESIVHMFQMALENAQQVIVAVRDALENHAQIQSSSNSSQNSSQQQSCSPRYDSNVEALEMLCATFDSVLLGRFIPQFIMHLHQLQLNCRLSYEVIHAVRPLIPVLASLNKIISSQFCLNQAIPLTTSPHYLVVESDHPYKPATVTSYLVKFPFSVKWITIEFDSKCSTAQPEDYLEIYIPNEQCVSFSENLPESFSKNTPNSFKNLQLIYRRYSGRNFSSHIPSNESTEKSALSKCILVPGNELVFMLKTSSDYVHSADRSTDAYYGFRAEVIGYELPNKAFVEKEIRDNTDSSNGRKENLCIYVRQILQNFENDLVYLFGLCIDKLLNASPDSIIVDQFDSVFHSRLQSTSNLEPKRDVKLAQKIFLDNFPLLSKGFNFEQPLTIEMIKQGCLSSPSINSFLDDFIKLTPQSSGARLALWFQNEALILPSSCLINVIESLDECCSQCTLLLETDSFGERSLCGRCHYQLLVKTLTQTFDCHHVSLGRKLFLKVVTRDQHEEIAFDSNALIELNIRYMTLCSGQKPKSNLSLDHDLISSPLLNTLSEHPYQVTVKDKFRYHAISMMKVYEDYTFEELRYYTQLLFQKKTLMEKIPVRSFDNGYYLASWTPNTTGCYKLELMVDGEIGDHAYLIKVTEPSDHAEDPSDQPIISDVTNFTKINLCDQSKINDQVKLGEKCKPRHCIRKFVCNDSAGLRIRALPSLQSEQIGMVAVNGLLTIVDLVENDDGVWVRLSNESIQAYCSNSIEVFDQLQTRGDNDNSESNLTGDLSDSVMKQSFTFTLRTEAWALQFNRHFNRTLLVPIDSEDDINDEYVLTQAVSLRQPSESELMVPSWFEVVNCSQDGHLIRNWPSLDDLSIIIGIVPLHHMVHALETVHNDFGLWVRLSQDSLYSCISALYKSTFFESNIEGWMLVQSVNGLLYMQTTLQQVLPAKDVEQEQHQPDLINNKYSVNDENAYAVPIKKAISNRAAQCIRAIFSAFVWHEGILHDVLTAASYLKFNAEVTKEFVKFCEINDNIHQTKAASVCRSNRKSSRQKTAFRHSVEVSQLFTNWPSDVNSNISDIMIPSLVENNNNNNNEESVLEVEKPEQTENELAMMIPEILISLLQIWEFVSSESLRVISYYSDANRPSLVPFRLNAEATENNNEAEIQWKHCKPCYCKMTAEKLEDEHSLMGQIMESFSNKYSIGAASEPCECDKQKCPGKGEMLGNEEQRVWRKHIHITNISHLYSSLDQSAHFLLALAPTNAPSLTDVAIDENLAEKGLLSQCQNTQLLLGDFRVDEHTLFHSLTHLGIQKSSYEKKLAEEKLSDLAVLSIQQAEDHQHLLSPECFEGWKNIIESDPESASSIGKNSVPAECIENRKTFKFYRSISVGLNYSTSSSAAILWNQRNNNQQLWSQLILKPPKHIKSSDALDQGAGDNKFNVPFLCKPSSRLLNLVQKYVQVENGQTVMFTIDEVMPTPQLLYQNMQSDVLKFIFSCYNVDMLRSVSFGALCSAAYRALALHIFNWLVIHVSSPSSLHDLMWNFVHSLLPESKQTSVEVSEEKTNETMKSKCGVGEVCRHPFHGLIMAGESAEHWVSEGLHQVIRSLADLLPLLPTGSPLQQMAMRCFGIDFLPRDHIQLHECKVFRHISTILTRASLEEPLNFDIDPTSSYKDRYGISTVNIAKDVTSIFELRASSRQAMLPSLIDNSTETFWESGHEDRNKLKHISIVSQNIDVPNQLERSYLKFACLYLDNTRDLEYKVSHVTFKLKNVEDIEKWNMASSSGLRNNDYDLLEEMDVDSKFVGWLQCEINIQQSREWASGSRQIRIELSGTGQYIRVRQIKVLSVPLSFEHLQCALNGESGDTQLPPNCYQIQTSNCEAETLRVFRLLTAQVFGKLLSSESNQPNTMDEKRLSFYQQNLNESDLREHMVGILFSQSGKLSELQKQVCSHIVREIHSESTRVREEWNLFLGIGSGSRRLSGQLPYDSYCFELLSLLLALSGSSVGCSYLSRQQELLFDMLTLLHTSSDRVKRQVLALMRRVLSNIKPGIFAQVVGIVELPTLSDIFAKIFHQGSSVDESTVLCHVGVLDFFFACIGKALTIQTKVKGFNSKSRYQAVHSMETIFDEHNVIQDQWWLRGSISKQIAQSILLLLKEMTSGSFGKEWAELASNCITEKILNLTRLSESHRLPDECIRTPTLWLALAALCALQEKDAEMLSSSHLSRYHDQANGNASQIYCENHDDGETVAFIQCNVCGNLCADCDRFLHLNPRTRSHKRHVFKEEVDSIKVDIHEGCGRVKFFWSLVVADSKLLKAMVEFRNCSMKKCNDGKLLAPDEDSLLNEKIVDEVRFSTGVCRFCASQDSQGVLAIGNVCNAEECQRFALEACDQVLECGHFCCGIVSEVTCLPCLHGCSGNLRQDGDDMCMICFSESLFAAPCIQLSCKHVFHQHCVKAVLEKRWSGGRIVFTFSQCPICKVAIEHPSLSSVLQPIQKLYEEVKQKARIRLEYENLHNCEAITTTGARFYNDPDGFAMEKYSYYLCFKCGKAYFGGEARCDAEYDGINFNPEELICGSCSDVAQAQICPKHGTDFLEYKCRFCCSVAVYFCFGSTHFCNACHDDFQRLVILKDYPKCPVGPRCVPLEGEECPLHVTHPPTGEEFALGCGVCRNTHTF